MKTMRESTAKHVLCLSLLLLTGALLALSTIALFPIPGNELFSIDNTNITVSRVYYSAMITPNVTTHVLSLKDTDLCDKYTFSLWGYCGEAITNGASHCVELPRFNLSLEWLLYQESPTLLHGRLPLHPEDVVLPHQVQALVSERSNSLTYLFINLITIISINAVGFGSMIVWTVLFHKEHGSTFMMAMSWLNLICLAVSTVLCAHVISFFPTKELLDGSSDKLRAFGITSSDYKQNGRLVIGCLFLSLFTAFVLMGITGLANNLRKQWRADKEPKRALNLVKEGIARV